MLQILQPLLPDLAPSATVSSTRTPHEPIAVKPEVTLVHITGAYTEWLTLGLPVDICVPPPTKLLGITGVNIPVTCVEISSHPVMEHITTSD